VCCKKLMLFVKAYASVLACITKIKDELMLSVKAYTRRYVINPHSKTGGRLSHRVRCSVILTSARKGYD